MDSCFVMLQIRIHGNAYQVNLRTLNHFSRTGHQEIEQFLRTIYMTTHIFTFGYLKHETVSKGSCILPIIPR
ncbi:hypothetical protein D3C73_720660 [compost metagenome]